MPLVVSIICVLTVIYLAATEYFKYCQIEIESKVRVNSPHHYDFNAVIPIFLNLSIPNVACPIFSVDVSDAMGRYSFDHNLSKVSMRRLFYDQNGDLKQSKLYKRATPFVSESDLKQMLNEGCRIECYLDIKSIPGNIHISGHSHDDLVDVWMRHSRSNSIDLSHIIHNFEIGNASINHLFKKQTTASNAYNEYLSFLPLNGFKSVIPTNYKNYKISYEYFVKFVSSKYKFLNGDIAKNGYQFTVSTHVNEQLYATPVINVRYDPSALSIEYIEKKQTFSHFIVQLLAICGGVYVCFLVINSFALSLVEHQKLL